MTGKGSKYARKRFVDVPQEKPDPLPDVHAGILDVIYDDVSFLDTFAALSLHDQIDVYQVLKKLSEEPLRKASKIKRRLINESGYKLDTINKWAGLCKEEMLRYPLSADEHHVIRMDCYGSVDQRPNHKLSTYYRNLCNKRISPALEPKDYHLEDKNAAPAWQIFRQFRNFRKIEETLKLYLASRHYDPNILAVMGVQDFSDLIFQTYKTSKNQLKVTFTDGDSERNAFVKATVAKKEDQIRKILLSKNWDSQCIDSFINAMKIYGNTDARKIVVTEKNFNPRILQDLKNAKIPTDGYRDGEPIPQSLVNDLAYDDKLFLIAMHDENGNTVMCDSSLEVHHKVAISEGGKMPFIAATNYRSNYLLTDAEIHRNVLHLLDKLVRSGGKEAYHCRLEFQDPNVAFMAGFSKKDQFDIDWTKDPEYCKRMEEDQKYVVDYDTMMQILEENRDRLFVKGRYCETQNKPERIDVDKTVETIKQKYAFVKYQKLKKHQTER